MGSSEDLNAGGKPVPAYLRIKGELQSAIECGELAEGQKIESERGLANLYGVSLMTARHALQVLRAEGLVTRQVGAGTFVAPRKVPFNKLLGFTELMAGRGIKPESRIIGLNLTEDNEEVASRLDGAAGRRLFRLERLRLGDGEPYAHETTFLSFDTFSGISLEHMENTSVFKMVEERGLTISHADEEIDVVSAEPQMAKLLAVKTGAALIRIRQLLYTTTGKAVLYDVGLYRADRHSLHVRRYR